MKRKEGITLISLIITIVLLIVISGTTIGISVNRFKVNNLKKMYNDIELLNDKVENYYLKFGGLPILNKYTLNINFNTSVNDNENYYIIDLACLENISLNYGKEGYEDHIAERQVQSNDLYIINEKTHIIYYVEGIESVDGNIYHSLSLKNTQNSNNIGPTKPEINIISESDDYVEIEIIPGKDNIYGIEKTEYNIKSTDIENNVTQTENIEISERTAVGNLSVDKAHEITAITTSNSGITSQYTFKVKEWIERVNIGDYINYDCYTGVSSEKLYYKSEASQSGYSSDQEFQVVEANKNMKWKVLGIDEKGQLLIISSDTINTITDSYYNIYGKAGYVNGPDELDNISKIFGYGQNAIGARSVKVEDVNRITKEISNDITFTKYTYTKREDGNVYRNDSNSSSVKYYEYYENDNPKSEWKELNIGETSPQIENDYYTYLIGNDTNPLRMIRYNDDGETEAEYWLASQTKSCTNELVAFYLRTVRRGELYRYGLYYSSISSNGGGKDLRPVVILSADILVGEKVNNIWQIN